LLFTVVKGHNNALLLVMSLLLLLRAIIMPFCRVLFHCVNCDCYAMFLLLVYLTVSMVSCASRVNSRGRESVRGEAVVAGRPLAPPLLKGLGVLWIQG
jgi:hypothetical protein